MMILLLGSKVCLKVPHNESRRKTQAGLNFKKMALRDKLEATRKRQSLNVLRDELSKNQDVRDKLENLVEQAACPGEAQTGMALHSASWYNNKVRDQLEMVVNRCIHLDKEVQTMQTDLSASRTETSKKTRTR